MKIRVIGLQMEKRIMMKKNRNLAREERIILEISIRYRIQVCRKRLEGKKLKLKHG